jgi:hypothetical protein
MIMLLIHGFQRYSHAPGGIECTGNVLKAETPRGCLASEVVGNIVLAGLDGFINPYCHSNDCLSNGRRNRFQIGPSG